MNIGQKIKQLRKQNSLTLEELASRCEVTKGFLSQLERNLTSPSVSTLEDILEALGSDLTAFFQKKKEQKIIWKKTDYFIDEHPGYKIQWIVPNAQKNAMEPILLIIQPQQSSKSLQPYAGEEFGYVLKGEISLMFEKKQLKVRKGQTFYMQGEDKHCLYNHTNEDATVLWITTPPVF